MNIRQSFRDGHEIEEQQMTLFNLYTGNHFPQARESLSDHVIWLTAGLEDAGHEVEFGGDNIKRDHLNIMWEHFIESYPEMWTQTFGEDVKFGIIVTEHFDGEGFNFHRGEGWKQRWSNFAKMAEKAAFLWTYFESDVAALGKRFGKPVALLELGFTEKLVIPKAPQAFIDFSFFGSQNVHRFAILDRLQTRGYKIYCPAGIVDRNAINALITHTKINIDAKGPNRIPMPSTARIGRILHASRGIAMEYVPQSTPRPSCFVEMCGEKEDFIDYCERIFHSDWQKKADATFELFRQAMPMRSCVERALDLVHAGAV